MNNKITYRQQFTRCGKQRCRKCREGPGHGPYWYAYWSENGRTVSKYIGIHPPSAIYSDEAQPPVPLTGEVKDSIRMNTQAQIVPGHTGKSDPHSIALLKEAPVALRKSERPILEEDTQPVLHIYLLGQFRVERRTGDEWQPVTNRIWHRRRARALLGCLLSHPGRRLGREPAMEALWPDLDIETAANRLNGAVHEVRQVLEPEITRPAASRMLRLERDVLILAGSSQIWVDAEAFENLLNKAHTTSDPQEAERLLEEAARLYGGDYLLEELYSEWAAPRRESLKRGWIGLLLKLAELRATRGALSSAIEPLDRLLTADPTHETAVRRLMVLLTQLDRRGEALRVYHRLASTLQRDYESEPLPETKDLYEALRQGLLHVPHTAPAGLPSQATAPQTDVPSTIPPPPEPGKTTSPVIQALPRPALQLGRHNQSPLVGRERELETMRQFLLAIESIPARDTSSQAAPEETDIPVKRISGELQARNARTAILEREQKLAHFLLLTGESGIGKTRLAEELSNEAATRGWGVVWAHTYEQEGTIPYRPWTEILRTLLKDASIELVAATIETGSQGAIKRSPTSESAEPSSHEASNHAPASLARLSTLVPELAAHKAFGLFPAGSSSTLPPEQERLHLWEAALVILRAFSRSAPLLLVLDDVHWTDDSSLELLAYLVRHLQEEHIAIIATCRDVELAPTSSLRTLINDLRREQAIMTLPIQPLDEHQIGSLVAYLPQTIVRSIQTQAGGNPFFAEELARVSETALPAQPGSIASAAQGTMILAPEMEALSTGGLGFSLPETITAVLDRRLGRLSANCQALLGKLAVLGGSFEFSHLSFMAGDQGMNEDVLLDLLEEALQAGLLTEEGTGTHITYHFWHPLIVSHLYERLSAARQAQLHRRAANALIQLHQGNEAEIAATITHHLVKAGNDPRQTAHYAEIAGNRAYALSAYSEAEYYYREAIKALSEAHGPGLAEQDPLHLASLLERVAECNMVPGNYEEIRHLYGRILELRNEQGVDTACMSQEEAQQWRQREVQRQALIWREIGRAWAENGDYAQARQCYKHGKQVMLDAGVTSGAAWACLHLEHGDICWREGNYDQARRYTEEALAMLEHVTQHQAPDKAASYITSTELPTRTALAMVGDPLELGRAHEILGVIAATLGQYNEALEHLHTALAIFEQRGLVTAITMVCGNLGAVYAMKAENAVASTYFQRALELAERSGDLPNIAFVTGNLGDVAARSGDLMEAEEWLRRSLALAERINDREHMGWCLVVLATALQDQGDMRGALECIRRALAVGRAMKSTRGTGFALVALGDWRVTHALEVCQAQSINVTEQEMFHSGACHSLLVRARAALERALALEGLDIEAMIEGRLTLATVHFLLGNPEIARQMALQSLAEASQHETTRVLARSRHLLGRILAGQGKQEEADASFEQALKVFHEHEMHLDYARALHSYGVTLVQRGTPGDEIYQRGLSYLLEARDIFDKCKAALDLQWVERILAAENERKQATTRVP